VVHVALGNSATHGNAAVVGVIFAGFGVLFASLAWRARTRYRRLADSGIRTQAQVIKVRRTLSAGSDGVGGRYVYKPVVSFHTQDGQQVTAEPRTTSSMTPAQVGEQVSVLYDPADPHSILLERFEKKWMLSLSMAVAAVFVIVGVAVITSSVIG
jgi:uncharacterized protein DUF3592